MEKDTSNKFKFLLNVQAIALILSVGAVLIVIFGLILRQLFTTKENPQPETPTNEQTVAYVTALGRIEPQGEIIRLAAPAANQRLAELRVKEGDQVRAGQTLAIMDNFRENQATIENAKAKVYVARSRLAQVRAGEKLQQIEAQRKKVTETEAEIVTSVKAQQAAVARQEIELSKAKSDYERYKKLSQDGAVSAADTETRRLQVEIEKEKLQEAKANLIQKISTGNERIKGSQATLESMQNVQPTDILVAQAELNESLSQLRQAEVSLDSTYVVAPVTGQVLNIHTKVGENVSNNGILDIGQTQQMYVIAEVYESDIKYVKVGQSATMVSEYGGFAGELKGVVEQIGLQIDQPGIVNDDPSAKADVRIVKVKIRLNPDDSNKVKTLNKLQVRASIKI